eukprot:SAG31_NODE_76_length_27534_cov_13.661868_10_plen_1603_part_00
MRQGSGGLYGGAATAATTHNKICDGCQTFPLVGARFKCLHCADFDLCSQCMFGHRQEHPADHFFARLTRRCPVLEGPIEPLDRFEPNPAALAAAVAGFGVVHQDVSCDACGATPLVGIRYKALGRPNWDLCERCLSDEAVVAIRTPLVQPAFEFEAWLVRAASATAIETPSSNASAQLPAQHHTVEPDSTSPRQKRQRTASDGGDFAGELPVHAQSDGMGGTLGDVLDEMVDSDVSLADLPPADVLMPLRQAGTTVREYDDFQATMLRSLTFYFDNRVASALQLDFVKKGADTELQTPRSVVAPASLLRVRLEDVDDARAEWPARWLVDVWVSFVENEWIQLGTVSGKLRDLSVPLTDSSKGAAIQLGVKMRIDLGTEFPNVAYNKTWRLSPDACWVSDASPQFQWLPPLVAVDGKPLYFDLDLGSQQFIRTAHLRLLPPPGQDSHRRRVQIRLHNFGEYEHPISFVHEVEEDVAGWVQFPEFLQCAMQVRFEITSPQGRVQISNLCIEAADAYGRTLVETFERAFKFHSHKNVFGHYSTTVGSYTWLTYGTIWQRVLHCSRGLVAAIAAANIGNEAGVGIMARNSQEWMIAQLACWTIGKTVVAIAVEIPIAQLAGVVQQGRVEVMLTDWEDLATIPKEVRLVVHIDGRTPPPPPPATGDRIIQSFGSLIETAGRSNPKAQPQQAASPSDEDRAALVMFTSGSSGRPKGVARTFRELNLLLRTFAVPQKAIHLSSQPLSHLSESVILPTIFVQGGQTVFCTRTQDVLHECRMLRPTFIYHVPRFFEVLHGLFEDAVIDLVRAGTGADEARKAVVQQFRGRTGPVGDRICVLSVGSAPVTPQLRQFMKNVWCVTQGGPAAVSHGYGSTECGTIAVNGYVCGTARVVLVERADIGVTLDGPRPRGELLVHTPQVVRRYAQGDASGFLVDNTPFFRPGDLCETTEHTYYQSAARRTLGSEWGDLAGCRYLMLAYGDDLEVVGRVKNCQKLSNGEFVSPESIEAALAPAEPAVVESFIVVVDAPANRVVSLVVPLDLKMADRSCRGQHEAALVKAFAAAADAAGLASYEVPTSVAILAEKWSAARGTLTSSNKVDRAGICRRHQADLQRLGVGAEPGGRKQTVDARVIEYLSAETDDAADAIFAGDNFADGTAPADLTLTQLGGDSIVAARIRGSFSSKLGIGQVVSLSIRQMRKLVRGNSSMKEDVSTAEHWHSETVWIRPPTPALAAVKNRSTDGNVLLITGVTGFIGPHLLSALIQLGRWGKIIALVRPPLSRVLIPPSVNVALIAANMGEKGLGLSDADWCMLADTTVDAVVHSAAHVDHIQTYKQLYEANVRACDELVALTAPSRPAFVFVSSVSAAGPNAGENLDSTSSDAVASLGGGYGQTKWVAERRLAAAAQAGCFRSLKIARLGLIGPHTQTGEHNCTDWLHLFLRAVAATKAVPEMAGDASIEMLPVDIAAAVLASMACNGAMRGVAVPEVQVVHVDARAAGVHRCLLVPLLRTVLTAAGAYYHGGAFPTLSYGDWHARVSQLGGRTEKALAVLPPPTAVTLGPFQMPSAAREDLQRGETVRSLVAALPSFATEPYASSHFLKQWESQFDRTSK